MKQYCRYCAHALDYNGEETDFICEAKAPCGSNGAGRFYSADKAKRTNRCKHFEFNENDIFRTNNDGTFVTYKPRSKYKPKSEPDTTQIKFDTP